ncbi:MAG: glycosyltransferase, partial [bacterium]
MQQGENLFFSLIIPAHNEEKYIVSTLEHIQNLNYPKNKFEVIVVENGSKDDTLSVSKKSASENIKIYSLEQNGVSRAKNYGIQMISPISEWAIILDADTTLQKNFLTSINNFLSKKTSQKYSIGTTYVRPIPYSLKARLWFSFYDIGHRITKASYAIQLVKVEVLKKFVFNEKLSIGEDLELIKFARKFGRFFVFKTKDVSTSVRRFEKGGWVKTFFVWTSVALLPSWVKKRLTYEVIR